MKLKKLLAMLFAIVMILSMVPMAAMADDTQYAARLLQIDSVSGSRIPIAGAEYEILDKDGKSIEIVKTDATGAAKFSNKITEGEYSVKTINSPAGYAKPANPIKVTVTNDDLSTILGVRTYSITVEMKAIRGSIVSCDKDGNPIEEAGAIFTLYSENGSPIESVVTNESGVAFFKKNIPYGNYMIKQTKAPATYYLNREPVKVCVDDKALAASDDGTMTFQFKINQSQMTAILIVKDAETKELIKKSGMEFHVQDEDGNDMFDLVTERGGVAEFPNPMAYGKYKIFPDDLPEGYYLNQEETVFEIKEADIELLEDGTYQYTCVFFASPVMTNVVATVKGPVLSGVKEEKKNGYDVVIPVFSENIIEGVELSILAAEEITLNKDVKAEEEDIIDSDKTNRKGVATLGECYIGNYKVVLDGVPAGYVLDKEYAVDVEADDGNQKKALKYKNIDVEIDMKDSEIKLVSSAEFMVSDGTDVSYEMKPLAGVVYGLYTAEEFAYKDAEKKDASIAAGTLIDVAVSDENGAVVFNGKYPLGKYTVKQLEVPEHYAKNEDYVLELDLVKAEVVEETVITVEAETNPENTILTAEVSAKNVNADDVSLEGAEFAIFDKEGNQIATGASNAHDNSEGASYTVVLAPGKYSAKQTKAANGYTLDPNSYDFEITDECTPAEVKTNSEKTVFEIVNLDKDGKPQAGVEFTAYDKDGNAVATAVSDENGIVHFEGLAQGEYEIKQTGKADGYKEADPITIDVNDTWQNSSEPRRLENKKDYRWIWFVAGGVALCAAAGTIIGVIASKKKKGSK